MFLHGSSYDAIQELVGVESLPEELGGTLGPAEQLYKVNKYNMCAGELFLSILPSFKSGIAT